jgi:preprotein translocase subunit SecA
MTGTADTEAEEFAKIYKLDVNVIPTNRPLVRVEEPDTVYRTEREKYEAIVNDIIEKQTSGRPTLVGTVSIEKSEKLSTMLKRRGIKHVVLNAKYHAQEAEIVAQAGRKDNVTIATNMAGRGTDILLGGNAEYMARQQSLAEENVAEKLTREQFKFVDDDEFVYFFHIDSFYRVPRADWERIFGFFKQQCDAEHDDVVSVGGLHIIATERHEARRIDNQLRGRAGRQGDPGSSRFYLSLEDDLMRIFGSDRISGLMQRLGMEEGVPIEHGMVTRAIERAQKQVEAQNFSVRKHLLEYDDVMNKQRENIYSLRRQLLEGKVRMAEDEDPIDTHGYLLETAEDVLGEVVERHVGAETDPEEWDGNALRQEVTRVFGLDPESLKEIDVDELNTTEIYDGIWDRAKSSYEEKMAALGPDFMQKVERDIMLQIVDAQWKDHLYSLDHLKEGIGLRGYGQRDPLVEYKRESFTLFQDMKARVDEEMVRAMWWLRPVFSEDGAPAAPVRRPPPRRTPLILNDPAAALNSGFPRGSSAAGAEPESAPGPNPFAPSKPKPARTGGDDAVKTVKREEPKVGRNDPCPCGSGKKYKKCHGVGQ